MKRKAILDGDPFAAETVTEGRTLFGAGRLKPWQTYLFAAVVTAATLGVRLAIQESLDGKPSLVIFTVPIMLSAYVGGLRAGLLATMLTYLGASYYLLPPTHSLWVTASEDRWQQLLVVLAGVVISLLNEALHRARRRADIATRQHQQAEAALREREEQLRLYVEHSPAAIAMFDRDMKYLVVSRRWLEAYRLTGQSIIGQSHYEVFPELPQRWKEIHRRCLAGAVETCAEDPFTRADGTVTWVHWEVRPWHLADGSVGGIIIFSEDITARKQAEDALRDSEQKLRKVIDGLGPDTFLGLMTLEGILIEANRPSLVAAGLRPEDVLGKPFDQTYWWGHSEPVREQVRAAMARAAAGETVRYEVQARVAGGNLVWIDFTLNPVRDASGEVIYLVPSATIIDERVRAEEALLKAGALQRAIFNSANFSCIATDATGVIQIFNVGAECMLGYAAAEVVNKITPADISDPQELIARAAALSREFATPIAPGFEALVFKAARGIEDIYELTKLRKDGSRFPAVLSVTALRDAQDAIIGYLLIGTDNTSRKQVEEERMKLDQRLRDQHFYTRSLLESNIDALMATDPHGIITDVNRQMEALTGCTRAELIGSPFKNYFTDSVRAEAGIKRVLTEGKVTNYELTARGKDGALTVVSYNAAMFHDRDMMLQGVFAAARDMTELKRYEETLQQKNVELKDASRMKSAFLANMSHELRTPLNAIIGFSEVLRDGLVGAVSDQQRGFIGDIFSSGKHLLALINDILDLSKVEAGKMVLDLEPVQPSSLFENSLSIVREKATAHRIRLDMDGAEELGPIQADPRKVKQIVYNLLSNAVKFTKEDGQITLRAGRVPRAEVGQLSGSWTGRSFPLADNEFEEFLKISVTDSGIGISPEGLEHLFKPFSQIDSGLARNFEGTGLGLAMVKLLVELHGGAVAVESAVGQGSCFTVWLPLRTLEEGAVTSVPAPVAARLQALAGARTALVVEDDFKAADLIRVQLEAEGFRVLHADSAEAALALVMQQPLSLITLDIMLPNMDGLEFLSRLKQVPDLQRIPVVIISIIADRNKGFALGAAAVMQKPVSRQELYDSLSDLGLFPVSTGRTLKVLIVDDDPKAVELVAMHIAGLATTVLRACGGRQAIATARRELPDVIVLDLMMPEVNGFDVVEALKEHPNTARIPILVVTAKEITAEDRARLSGSLTTIMEKADFDPDRFVAEVQRAMSGRVA